MLTENFSLGDSVNRHNLIEAHIRKMAARGQHVS